MFSIQGLIPNRVPSSYFRGGSNPPSPLSPHPFLHLLWLGKKTNYFLVNGVSHRYYVKISRSFEEEKLIKRNKYLHISEVVHTFGVKGSTITKNTIEKIIEKKPGYGDPSKVIMKANDLGKTLHNGRTLFEDVNLSFFQGAKIGILGMNGAGKSTLMKVLAGIEDDFEGDVEYMKGARVGYLAQEPILDETKTVKENILSGVAHLLEPLSQLYALRDLLKNGEFGLVERNLLEERYITLEKIVQDQKLLDFHWQVERAISALKCPPPDSSVHFLSGGERRRVALARLLIARPDILLLDEPTNHLDAASVAWLENFLGQYKGMVLAITHDRYFLDNVAGWILEIEGGRCHPFEGNYTQWLVAKKDRLELEKRKQLVLEKQVKAELEWVQQCPKGRQAKSRSRIDRFEKLQGDLRGKIYEPGVIVIPPGPRLGKDVISVQSLTKTINTPGTEIRRLLFRNVSFKLERGGIVGVIGPNGSGKTTFLKILGGLETPDSGEIKIGQTVKMGYACQSRSLDPNNTVFQEISEGLHEITVGDTCVSLRKYIACFNFKSGQQDRRIGDLSGGERNRVHLAKMLKSNVNVILLDEPTNDIDIEVLRSLEEGIQEYPGCVVVVSHDRWFLDRIATHILAFEDNGSAVFFEGNYSAYESVRGSGKDLGVFANITKRGVW